MAVLGVTEGDLQETFIHASGPGGQHVNKVATAVHLLHRPTGIAVKCEQTRSQAMNRFLARRILLAHLESAQRGEKGGREMAKKNNIRRQKYRRARRAQHKRERKSMYAPPP